MADSSTPVRLLQHHLRTAGARIAARDYEAAAEHIEAALAIDPASLAALTLRERIQKGRTAAPPKAALPRVDTTAPKAQNEGERPSRPDVVTAAELPGPMRFIPAGVDAASWLDFEQRVQERRYRGLVDTAEKAMAMGDAEAATAALDEARDLRPDSSEVTFLLSRIALMPAVHPAIIAQRQDTLFHSRAFRAVSLLFVGVTLLIGIDWMRADVPPAAVTAALDTTRTPVRSAAGAPVSAAAERVINVARSTAAETPALTGSETSPADVPAVQAPRVEPDAVVAAERPPVLPPSQPTRFTGEVPDHYYVTPPPPPTIAAAREPVVAPPPRGEIDDDYVAPRRPANATSAPADLAADRPSVTSTPSNSPLANVARQPAPVELLGRGRAGSAAPSVTTPPPVTAAPPPAAVAPTSAAVATAEVDRQRVRNVVNQYTRAYGALDVNAVKSIWPTVKERELARAFSNLSSQTLSLDCDEIAVNGTTARASCSGRARYVGKVGSQVPREEPRTVTFQLRRAGDSWLIQDTRTER